MVISHMFCLFDDAVSILSCKRKGQAMTYLLQFLLGAFLLFCDQAVPNMLGGFIPLFSTNRCLASTKLCLTGGFEDSTSKSLLTLRRRELQVRVE